MGSFSRQLVASTLAIFILGAGALVWAAGDGPPPRLLPYRGHVELDGTPLSGSVPMTFTLFDDATMGTPIHQEAMSVDLVSGQFAIMLGQSNALSDAVLTAAELFVAVSVNGTPLAGRQRIGAATRVMDNPGTFTVGTLSATTIGTETFNASGPASAGSFSTGALDAASVTATGAVSASSFTTGGTVSSSALELTGAGGGGAIRAMQSGIIGTCNGTNHNSQASTVNFTPGFSTTPIVMLTVAETDDTGCTSARIRGISTNSFAWRSYNLTASAACDCIHWVAFVQD